MCDITWKKLFSGRLMEPRINDDFNEIKFVFFGVVWEEWRGGGGVKGYVVR